MVDGELLERKLRQLDYRYEERCNECLQYIVEEELALPRNTDYLLYPFFINAVEVMRDAQEMRVKIIVEGSQTLMLDIDFWHIFPCYELQHWPCSCSKEY